MPARVLVTRPQPQADAWVQQLRSAGLPAMALPLIEIGPAPDPEAVRAMAAGLQPGMLVMFVSPNAVSQFAACLPPDWAWPDGVQAACTGPGTMAALHALGAPPAAVVAPAPGAVLESESLWARLRGEDWRGRRVWIVRGEGGRDWLASTLREAGADVAFLQAYQRRAPAWTPAQQALAAAALTDPAGTCWLLSSSEAIDHLATLLPQARWELAWALASHERIAARARQAGFGRVEDVAAGAEGVVQALKR
ncbi:uroporphyrinogen-III synthase [Ideonella oryzae]|uniref:Uroporphyrinogen-III synthase n=1 Tax=Ideonella oryzae TaxID=2937441 RepID=A0ABT1BJX6_9BURK|nr:uroporphyrinogen-III synthase [Ideonella oryzae]MCO5976408.1 uroporphyrinogen-III synthase [Ideonella oryzae]